MSEIEFDFMVVGQGLAGSVLSSQLIENGFKILVIDHFNAGSSSQVAAGLVNPITGRRVVKSWMADTLIPFAESFYRKIEKVSGQSFYHSMDVLEVVHSVKEANEWTSRTAENEMKKYLSADSPDELYKNKINGYTKMIRISSSAWMNIPLYIDICRSSLKESSSLLELKFDYSLLRTGHEYIEYENHRSKAIIFCEGTNALQNPLWKWIPLVPAKGEILSIECRDLPEEYILLSGIFLIPIGNRRFRIGSTFEWDFKDELPTENGKQKLIEKLDDFLKVPYTVVEHRAGIRPTVKDRRPIIGCHPDHKNVFVFNGMGTKGVQLAPFFADHFVKFLGGGNKLMDEINSERFY